MWLILSGRTNVPERTCSVGGCCAPHRARGLCSTHYNRQHQPARHRKVIVACGWCRRPTTKSPDTGRGYQYRFCSLSCRDTWRQRGKLPVAYVGTVERVRPTYPTPKSRRWVAGRCQRCGAAFVAMALASTSRYCSHRCAKRVAKHRYRARKRDAYVANVSPAKVYARDGWRCQLCGRKVRRRAAVPHPLAPVLDHIVPLARGGTHEPANVQCAHYLCNCIKSDSLGTVQLALFG